MTWLSRYFFRLPNTSFNKSVTRAAGLFLIFFSSWPTITDVDLLEREIGKPVITSSQAYIWHALKMAKVKQSVNGFGRLMASLAN